MHAFILCIANNQNTFWPGSLLISTIKILTFCINKCTRLVLHISTDFNYKTNIFETGYIKFSIL